MSIMKPRIHDLLRGGTRRTLLTGLSLAWPALAPLLAQTPATNASLPERFDPIRVVGDPLGYHSVASESDRVGPAQQPEWTARRAFAETDVYVIPPGEVEFNQFYILSHPKHEKPENLFESEFEFGLPWRTQVDVEFSYSLNSNHGRYDSTLVEVPHALADWGRIPLNPTVDAGWRFNNGTDDSWFVRLLLAEELGPRVHFGANLSFERQIGGDLATAYELNTAVNYVVIDHKLSIGAELLVEHELAREIEYDDYGVAESETERETSVMLGPSVLFRPSRQTYLSVVPLFGLTSDAPKLEAFFIFGIDFEPFARRGAVEDQGVNHDDYAPVRRPR